MTTPGPDGEGEVVDGDLVVVALGQRRASIMGWTHLHQRGTPSRCRDVLRVPAPCGESTATRRPSGPRPDVLVGVGHAQVQHQRGEEQQPERGDGADPPADAAVRVALAEPVGHRGAQGAGEHVGGPERDRGVQPEPPQRERHEDQHAEEGDGPDEAQSGVDRGGVAERGAEAEGEQHDAPVEALAPRGGDRVHRDGALALPPPGQQADQQDQVDHRVHPVRRPERDVRSVGDHRAEQRDAQHRDPVAHRVVASRPAAGAARAAAKPPTPTTAASGMLTVPRKSAPVSPMPVVRNLTTQNRRKTAGTLGAGKARGARPGR